MIAILHHQLYINPQGKSNSGDWQQIKLPFTLSPENIYFPYASPEKGLTEKINRPEFDAPGVLWIQMSRQTQDKKRHFVPYYRKVTTVIVMFQTDWSGKIPALILLLVCKHQRALPQLIWRWFKTHKEYNKIWGKLSELQWSFFKSPTLCGGILCLMEV